MSKQETTNPAAPFIALGLTDDGGFIRSHEFCIWQDGGEWGIAWTEEEGYSLVDVDGHPANGKTKDADTAVYAFERAMQDDSPGNCWSRLV